MAKLPKFFDWKGELGRYDYFVEGIKHGAVYALVLLIYMGLCYMIGWSPNFDDESTILDQYIGDSFMIAASIACFVPLYIKRARDIGMSLWWVAALEFLSFLPEPPAEGYEEQWVTYALTVYIPLLVYLLILQFRPGKAYREHKRNNPRNSKVTFSE